MCVPNCCFYEGDLTVSCDAIALTERSYRFSFILFEESLASKELSEQDLLCGLRKGFVLDCLLGNWRLFGFSEKERFNHIDRAAGARRNAESAFGLVYWDDQKKTERTARIIPWSSRIVHEIESLRKHQPWVYGQLSDDDITQQVAALCHNGLERHISELFRQENDLRLALLARVSWLQQRLNWYKPLNDSKNHPCARDGHTAVVVGHGNERRMIIFGGATGAADPPTPLGDLWQLSLGTTSCS